MFKLIVLSSALSMCFVSAAVAKPNGNHGNKRYKKSGYATQPYQGRKYRNRRHRRRHVVAPVSRTTYRPKRVVRRHNRRYAPAHVVVKSRRRGTRYSPPNWGTSRRDKRSYRRHNRRRYGWSPAYYGGVALARQAAYLANITHQPSRRYFRGFFARQDRMARKLHNKYEAGMLSTTRYERMVNRLRTIEQNRSHYLSDGWLSVAERSELNRQQNRLGRRIARASTYTNGRYEVGYF